MYLYYNIKNDYTSDPAAGYGVFNLEAAKAYEPAGGEWAHLFFFKKLYINVIISKLYSN